MSRHACLSGVARLATTLAIAWVATSLAGCSRPQPAQEVRAMDTPAVVQEVPAAAPTAPGTPAAGPTQGGDGSEIQLDTLTMADVEGARLSGELACSFSLADAPPLLYATGVVASNEPAQGVVKVAGYVERVGAPGGFEGITTDPTFTGQGKTVLIALTGPATGGGESPPRPATLTYQRADGASRTFTGQ